MLPLPMATKTLQEILELVSRRCSVKKVFLKLSQNSEESTCARVSFLINSLRPATLLRKRFWRRCFPVNFVKFLRTLLKKFYFYRTPLLASFEMLLRKSSSESLVNFQNMCENYIFNFDRRSFG